MKTINNAVITNDEIIDGIDDYCDVVATILDVADHVNYLRFYANEKSIRECGGMYDDGDDYDDYADDLFEYWGGDDYADELDDLNAYLGIA